LFNLIEVGSHLAVLLLWVFDGRQISPLTAPIKAMQSLMEMSEPWFFVPLDAGLLLKDALSHAVA